MVLDPKKFRELVFVFLFSCDFGGAPVDIDSDTIMQLYQVSRKNVYNAREKAEAMHKALPELDAMIKRVSHSYDLERIHPVERTILRLALYELYIHNDGVSPDIIIAEAKRLAKKFATPDAASFVYGILAAIQTSTK